MRTGCDIPGILERLGIEPLNSGACGADWIANPSGGVLKSTNPATGETLARVKMAGLDDYEHIAGQAVRAFLDWRMVPAPRRGHGCRSRFGCRCRIGFSQYQRRYFERLLRGLRCRQR